MDTHSSFVLALSVTQLTRPVKSAIGQRDGRTDHPIIWEEAWTICAIRDGLRDKGEGSLYIWEMQGFVCIIRHGNLEYTVVFTCGITGS